MAEVTGLRNNALPYPVYGVPFGIIFPILDADGDPVTGATALDSERSLNGDTFADCTNEATEIATASGFYYLLLTAAELTADVVTVQVKTSSSGAKTTPIVLYPRKLVALRSGTAQGGAAGYITLDASAGAKDDIWNGCLVVGTLDSAVEDRIITDYTGSSQQAAVTPNWNTTPDSDDTFIVYLPEGVQIGASNPVAWLGTAISTPTVAGVPNVNAKTWNDLTTVALPLIPTVAGRTLDVTTGGEAGIDLANLGAPAAGAVPYFGIIDGGTAQSATATTLVFRAGAAFANDEIVGATIVITGGSAGVGQSKSITDYDLTTDTATVDTWTTTPTGTITYIVYPSPPATAADTAKVDAIKAKTDNLPSDPADASVVAGLIAAAEVKIDAILVDTGTTLDGRIPAALTGAGNMKTDVLAISGDATAADNLEAAADGGSYNLGGGAVVAASVTGNVATLAGAATVVLTDGSLTAAKIAADAITAAKIADGAIDAATFAAGAINAAAIAADAITDAKVASDVTIASVTGAVGSVTGAVGSVTGAVGSVTGAVGSVTGAVGSVTGNVGGNVVGSVASVTAGVSIATGGVISGAIAAAELNAIADALLDRNMATGTDSGADNTTTRTVRQALRRLRNKEAIVAGVGTVRKEDDATASWTYAATTAAGNPLSSVDPT